MAIRNYDPEEVMLVFGGRTLTGYGTGSYMTAQKTEAKWATHVGAQGEVGRSRNRNPLGTVTVTLSRTSPDLDFMIQKMNSDDIDSCYVIDRNDKEIRCGGSESWISMQPGFEATGGDAIPEMTFEIQVADFEMRMG